jgi:2'-5' RNA ligase
LHRLFVAVWPSRHVIGSLRRLPRLDHPQVRWTTERQWHVTLRFHGDVDDPTPVGDALEAGLVAVAPAVATAERRARRYGPGALGVPVHGLDELATAVEAATARWGTARGRPFRGHLTLARCRGRVPAAAMATGLPALRWDVDEVALVRSHLDRAGARYETLRVVGLVR